MLQRRVNRRILVALGWYSYQTERGIAQYAMKANWTLDNFVSRTGQISSSWKGDGVIAILGVRPDLDRTVLSLNVPVVDLAMMNTSSAVARVLPDSRGVAEFAVNHFLERNFRHFASLNLENTWIEEERHRGFVNRLKEHGHSCHELNWVEHFGGKSWYREEVTLWLAARLEQLPKPLALFTHNDDFATLALAACEEAGLLVPEEIAILGVDNDDLKCDFAHTPLSSVDSDLEGLGFHGAALLDALIKGQSAPETPLRLPPKGVALRRSTDILAAEELEVAKVLRFIWDHYAEPISAEYVAEQSKLSRSTLYRTFTRQIGRPIAEEILRVRLREAKKALLETDLKAKEIARLAGFSDIVVFSRAFRRVEGISISQFRQEAGAL